MRIGRAGRNRVKSKGIKGNTLATGFSLSSLGKGERFSMRRVTAGAARVLSKETRKPRQKWFSQKKMSALAHLFLTY